MFIFITEDAPPTILIRIPAGSASVEPSGVLAVYPGSTLHLECLFSRRLGSPDWTWTSPLGQYLTGEQNKSFTITRAVSSHQLFYNKTDFFIRKESLESFL